MTFLKERRSMERIICCNCGVDVHKVRDSAAYRNHPWCGPCDHAKCSSCGLRVGKHHELVPNKLVIVDTEYIKIMEHMGTEKRHKKQGILKLCKLCYIASKKRTLMLHGKLRA